MCRGHPALHDGPDLQDWKAMRPVEVEKQESSPTRVDAPDGGPRDGGSIPPGSTINHKTGGTAMAKKKTVVVHMLEGLPNEVFGPDDVEVVIVMEEEHGAVSSGHHKPSSPEKMHPEMKEIVKATLRRPAGVERKWDH